MSFESIRRTIAAERNLRADLKLIFVALCAAYHAPVGTSAESADDGGNDDDRDLDDDLELVVRDDLDDEDLREGAPRLERLGRDVDAAVHALQDAGHDVDVWTYGARDDARIRILYATEAGAPRRLVLGPQETVDFLALAPDSFAFLTRYDGFSIADEGRIEVGLRSLGPFRSQLERVSSEAAQGGESIRVERGGVLLSVGPPSPLGELALTRTRHSLQIQNLDFDAQTPDDAFEPLGEAFLLDLDLKHRLQFSFTSVDVARRPTGRARQRTPAELAFPKSRFPHEAVALFRAGQERRTSPIIRYWSYYQVLEYFFPRYSLENARTVARQALVDPRFDPHADSDVARLVELLSARLGHGRRSESQDLETTVMATVEEESLQQFIEHAGLTEILRDKESPVSSRTVRPGGSEDVRRLVADRVYDVRCRIVHAKSDGGGRAGGLLPGTEDEEWVRRELDLVQFLAERALVASAEPLTFRALR
jgi:hypothetical protein